MKSVKDGLLAFVASKDSEVLVLKGKWGVGKTYFWKDLIVESGQQRSYGHAHYAYVSLFGVNDLEELRSAILVSRSDFSDFGGKVNSWSPSRFLKDVEKLPKIREWTGGLASAYLFMAVRDTLICFDDLERKGDALDFKSFFGLVSALKESKGCKVAIIVNEDTLSDEERASFRRHGEKLIDSEVEFIQTPEGAIECVFPEDFFAYQDLRQFSAHWAFRC